MTLYAGIDFHSNNNVVVVQDEEDNVVWRRLANNLHTVTAWLEPYRGDLAGVVVESTYNQNQILSDTFVTCDPRSYPANSV